MSIRCPWCGTDPEYINYHDHEWGVPVHDDRLLFEFLTLEGAQAGLSWLTILKKRSGYRQAFANFDIKRVSAYTTTDIERLMTNPAIVRNRLKITSAIKNARGILKIQAEHGSFSAFIWGYVNNTPSHNSWNDMEQIPSQTDISRAMSRDLKKLGFNFVGPTICYAFMQAIGMVNDHIVQCFRYQEIKNLT
jgi:DNA-3-methyladenine glycosylase I